MNQGGQNQKPEKKPYTPEEREKNIAELQKKPIGLRITPKVLWYSALVIVCFVVAGMFIDSMSSEDVPSGQSVQPSTITYPSATTTEPAADPNATNKGVISNLRYTIVEKNSSWWKYSWQLSLKNNTSSTVEFYISVNFLDSNGYIIDDDVENPPFFNPKEQRTIKGYEMVDADVAPNVSDVEAEILSAFYR